MTIRNVNQKRPDMFEVRMTDSNTGAKRLAS
jgi:hypothetical protein